MNTESGSPGNDHCGDETNQVAAPMMKVQVEETDVYIVGTSYSGSTLLGNALNGHPSIAYAGEVQRLTFFDTLNNPQRECFVCSRGGHLAAGRTCPVWNDAVRERLEAAGPNGATAVLREATGVPVVVDGSKDVEWLRRVFPDAASADGRRVRVIMTVRHPFSFAATCKRRDSMAAWESSNMWRDTIFDAFRTLSRLNFPFTVVRYEEFAYQPEPVLRQLCGFIGIPWDQAMLEFWNKPVHPVGGNPGGYVWYPQYRDSISTRKTYTVENDREVSMRYAQRQFGGWVDDKWRDLLCDAEIDMVMTTPMLVGMATQVGYDAAQFRIPLRAPETEPAVPAAPAEHSAPEATAEQPSMSAQG